jgi:hypothetical protein
VKEPATDASNGSNGSTQATVRTLTAEVKVLMVGNRQVTLSVYRQLDAVRPDQIEPFGRVSDSQDHPTISMGRGYERQVTNPTEVFVVGRSIDTGALVRSRMEKPEIYEGSPQSVSHEEWGAWCNQQHKPSDKHKWTTAWLSFLLGGNKFCTFEMLTDECTQHEGLEWFTRHTYPALSIEMLAVVKDKVTREGQEILARFALAQERYVEWCALPLIVLAGLR